jgi:hypothetical protein
MARHTGEDFIDVKGIAVTTMFPFQSSRVYRTEFYTPESNCFPADSDVSLSKQIFDIAMAEIELTMQPDGAGDSIWWESVSLISIHGQGVSISAR